MSKLKRLRTERLGLKVKVTSLNKYEYFIVVSVRHILIFVVTALLRGFKIIISLLLQ